MPTGYEDWSHRGWEAHLPGLADVRGYAAGLGEQTIPELAAAAADRAPDRIAVTVDAASEPLLAASHPTCSPRLRLR